MSTTVIHVASRKDIPTGFTGIAIIDDIEAKCWYFDGKLHREDGPAREWSDGKKEWWREGTCLHLTHYTGNGNFNYIVLERGIPTDEMLGNLKLTQAKLLMAGSTVFVYDNLPGGDEIGEGNE
jgi:hypothetical protein